MGMCCFVWFEPQPRLPYAFKFLQYAHGCVTHKDGLPGKLLFEPAFLLRAMVLMDCLQDVLVQRKIEVAADGCHLFQDFIIKGNVDVFHSQGKISAFRESALCHCKAPAF